MSYLIDIQIACDDPLPVPKEALISWAELTLTEHFPAAEITLRLTTSAEITLLNQQYRQQSKPTNVLAFPSQLPPEITLDYPFLGDIIICPSVLVTESVEQKKPLTAHWAHIVIHGILHLLGFDHQEDKETYLMQAYEIKLLEKLGFSNPYFEENGYFE